MKTRSRRGHRGLRQPSALIPQPSTLNPQPSTLNPQPSSLNPQPSTPNPKLHTKWVSERRQSRSGGLLWGLRGRLILMRGGAHSYERDSVYDLSRRPCLHRGEYMAAASALLMAADTHARWVLERRQSRSVGDRTHPPPLLEWSVVPGRARI